jgi:hypothetical protein
MIKKRLGIPIDDQKLLCGGKELDNSLSLVDRDCLDLLSSSELIFSLYLPKEGQILVSIKSFNDELVKFPLSPTDSIKTLKEKVEKTLAISMQKYELKFAKNIWIRMAKHCLRKA